MGFTDQEKIRLKALVANPELLNQGCKNCCGTIVIISGILDLYKINKRKNNLNKDYFNNLYTKIVHDVNVSSPFNKAYHLGTRLQKRVDARIIIENDTSADIKLGIAILLMFKQYLRQSGRKDIWDHCEKYSVKMVSTWKHGKNIKQRGRKYKPQEMTYKNGDIAITREAIQQLLWMVSRAKNKSLYTEDLSNSTVQEYLNKIKSYPDKDNLIIVMGVKIASQKDEMHQGGLVHWVYVPHANLTGANNTILKVWTWGREYEIRNMKDLKLDRRKWGAVASYAMRMS